MRKEYKCFILTNTNTKIVNNHPIIIEDEHDLIELLEMNNSTYTIEYKLPDNNEIYYNLNGDLIYGNFEYVDE